MPGYPARATPELKACIDLIVRPGRHPLAPDITEARLERVAGAASGRLGKDTVTSPDALRRALRGAQEWVSYPLLVSVNQEGGRLNALDWPQVAQLPANLALGAGRDGAPTAHLRPLPEPPLWRWIHDPVALPLIRPVVRCRRRTVRRSGAIHRCAPDQVDRFSLLAHLLPCRGREPFAGRNARLSGTAQSPLATASCGARGLNSLRAQNGTP